MDIYKAMGPMKRAALGVHMADESRMLARDGIRRRHPDYDEAQLEDAVRILFLGKELFRLAWPNRALVQP